MSLSVGRPIPDARDPQRLAGDAPTGPGVYFLVDRNHRLVYVGKAANLRRRLADHSRSSRWSQVGDVRWEPTPTEQLALARESDVIAALRPPWNKTHVDAYFAFISVTPKGLMLGADGEYGCFPHLGRGAMSEAGRACIDGYDALNRIVRRTRPERHYLDDFLTGRSDRLLRLPLDIDQPHIRLGVEKDRRLASRFFEAGPVAMRVLRLRHGGRGNVSRAEFVAWVTAEIEAVLTPELPGV